MAHNILNDMSWMANQVQANPDGWSLELGPAIVARLIFDENVAIELGGGARIVINETFRLRAEGETLQVDPCLDSGKAAVRELLHRSIQQTVVNSEGTLELSFAADNVSELKLDADPHTWKVYFANGSACLGLLEGGLEFFPPRHIK